MAVNGFIPLNKPVGLSSQQAVSRLKSIVGVQKAGHTGTLDPLASGLLLVGVGKATRLCQYFLTSDKSYRAKVEFGIATSTGDKEGQVTAQTSDFSFSVAAVEEVLKTFTGRIAQKPPAASAIKLNGKRAFSLFRQGLAPEMPQRFVTIKTLRTLSPQPLAAAQPYLYLEVVCSKGTYIRSLAEDIGTALGCPAHLAELVRTQVGNVALGQAATFADLEQDYRPYLLDASIAVAGLPALSVEVMEATALIRGQVIANDAGLNGEIALFLGPRLVGIGRATTKLIKPDKIFMQVHEL